MARLDHYPSLVLPISFLLLLLAASTGAADPQTKKKVVGMTMRRANEEEARWLDRYAETHEPLGSGGPLKMRRATEEEAKWLDRFHDGTTKGAGESRGGAGEDGDGGSIEFDEDNPYVEALRAWVSRWTAHLNLNGDPEDQEKKPDAEVQVESKNDVQDL